MKTIPLSKASKRVKEIESEVLSRNGGKDRDFTNKEVYLLLLDEMSKKLDRHIEITEELQTRYIPEFNKQVEILDHICKEMPDKGWCGNVNTVLFPEKDVPLAEKVNLLWNDRRWLKGLLYFITALGLGNLLLVGKLMLG